MDIVKLLSRSTKQSRNTGSEAPRVKLPSAGTAANPQLFHDDVPGLRGMKRKRDSHASATTTGSEAQEEEFNFFAPKESKQESRVSSTSTSDTKKEKRKRDRDNEPDLFPAEPSHPPCEFLDESQCRQIMRSHRLKVAILPTKAEVDAAHKKRKRMLKRLKGETGDTKLPKVEPKQIYPAPLGSFSELRASYGISRRLAENIAKQGYKVPTEVQMSSLPLLLKPTFALHASKLRTELDNGIDLLAVAPTGSGKTVAFLIPIISAILKKRSESKDAESHELQAIVVANTRELASQITNECHKLTVGLGIKVVEMKKGMRIVRTDDEDDSDVEGDLPSEDEDFSESEDDGDKFASQKGIKAMKQNAGVVRADILITTPLMLVHSISKGSEDDEDEVYRLPTVRHLVLDEADDLLCPRFLDQTMKIWNSCINPFLRVTLWSATMGSSIESLAAEHIETRRTTLQIPSAVPLVRLVVGLKDAAIPNIDHRLIYAATESGKLLALRNLIHPTSKSTRNYSRHFTKEEIAGREPKQAQADDDIVLRPPFLIFTQTIPRAQALHAELLYDIPAAAGGPTRIAVLHSSLSDTARSNIMTRFRNGEIWILITTDLLARGVDFRGINAVVNYDVPGSMAAYVHRVGRTGRAGREGGMAVTLWTKEDIDGGVVRGIANMVLAGQKAEGKEHEGGVQKWLLDMLPKVGKREKKEVKLKGVESRRANAVKGGAKSEGKAKISTVSGYERKVENKRKGAIEASKRRKSMARDDDENANWKLVEGNGGDDDEWEGIEED